MKDLKSHFSYVTGVIAQRLATVKTHETYYTVSTFPVDL